MKVKIEEINCILHKLTHLPFWRINFHQSIHSQMTWLHTQILLYSIMNLSCKIEYTNRSRVL